MIKVVELFAGVGGFRVGFDKVNKILEKDVFDTIWANQWEPSTKSQPAFDCYVEHYGKEDNHTNIDIADVHIDDIPEHDLLVGGFPCQDYSVARSLSGELGIQGKKGVLFWEIMRIVHWKKPKYILLENVDRLLKSPSVQRGRDFAVMLGSLRDEGYIVEWRVINAADYGHAQRRRRVFIFAYRGDTQLANSLTERTKKDIIYQEGFFAKVFPVQEEVFAKHSPINGQLHKDLVDISDLFSENFLNAGVLKGDYYYSAQPLPVYIQPVPLRDILEEDVNEKYYLDDTKVTRSGKTLLEQFKYLKGSKKIERIAKNGHKYIYSEGGMAFPDDLDKPGRTMLTSEATTNRSTHIVQDPITSKLRTLTPVECERLNGFPDNWTNTGMTDRNRYFCMGNALVVDLITEMGMGLYKRDFKK